MRYYVSWSPKTGEATYTRCFSDKEERDKFAAAVYGRCINTWDSN